MSRVARITREAVVDRPSRFLSVLDFDHLQLAACLELAAEMKSTRASRRSGTRPLEGLHVACGEGTAIELVDIQVEGKRVVSARDAIASKALVAGAQFTAS